MTIDANDFLRDIWYFAMPSAALKPGEMRDKTLLEEPLVFARTTEGKVFALRDICPHRGIPLSDGWFDGKEVECCYHGWRFAPNGHCTCIPSLTEDQTMDVDAIRVRPYPVEERGGGIWVYMSSDPRGRTAPKVAPPDLPEVTAHGPGLTERMIFPSHIDHAVIGLMDPAHGPFVHQSWWWRSRRSIHEKAKRFGPADYGFAMLRHQPSSNSAAYKLLGGTPTTEIRFRLPGIRIEDIEVGTKRVCNLTTVTPIDRETTEIHHMMYWNVGWAAALKPILRIFARNFLGQDRDVVVKQQRGLKYDPNLMLINDADMQAKWYYRLKKAYGGWSEGEFQNPVRETTLRWRS
jgi:phenylpropionate dioxygenase-like ring-hydroxylating dioxygenase large terminal subunit